MGIETGGHQLAQYTRIPDTKFEQADPNAVNTGILAQFKLASDIEKEQAFKMQQEEIQQLHADRQAAAHADLQNKAGADLAAIELRPVDTANKRFAQDTTAQTLPLDRIQLIGEKTFANSQMPVLHSTQDQINTLANELQGDKRPAALNNQAADVVKSEDAVFNADLASQTARAKAIVEAADATFAADNLETAQAVRLQALNDAYANAQTDSDRRRLKEELANELVRSQVIENKAQADWNLRRQSSTRSEDTTKEINALLTAENKILNKPLTSGVTVQVYREDKSQGGDIDPEGERELARLAQLEQLQVDAIDRSIDSSQKKKDAKVVAANPPVEVRYPSQVAPAPTEGQGVYDTPSTAAPAPSRQGEPDQVESSNIPDDLKQAWRQLKQNPQDPNGPALVAIIDKFLRANQAAGKK